MPHPMAANLAVHHQNSLCPELILVCARAWSMTHVTPHFSNASLVLL